MLLRPRREAGRSGIGKVEGWVGARCLLDGEGSTRRSARGGPGAYQLHVISFGLDGAEHGQRDAQS